MNRETKIFETKKYNMALEYTKIDELPSMFRFYPIKKLYIRPYNLLEIEALSKIDFENANIKDIVNIFEDIIKFEDNFSILDLEYIDFLVISFLVSTLTIEDYKAGLVSIKCQNLVPNPEINKLKKEVELLKDKLPKIKDENELKALQNEIIEKQTTLNTLPNKSVCNFEIQSNLTLFDFEFEDPKVKEKEKIIISNKQYNLKPILVKDIIEIEEYKKKENKLTNDELKYFYAKYIEDLDLEEALKVLLYSPISVYKQIKEWDEKVTIEINPIQKRCPKCGHINKVYVSMDDIKVYP